MLGKLKDRLEGDVHLKDLVKGSVTFFIIRVLGLAVAYAFTLLVTRKLGASAWGIFTICFTILQIVSVIGRLGLDTALLRFIAQYNAQGKGEVSKHIYLKSISVVIPFSLLLSAGLYLLAPILAEKVFGKEHLTPYIRLIAFAVAPFTLLYINSESLRAFKKIKEYAVFQNLLPFLIALITVGTFLIFLNIQNTELVLFAYIAGVSLAFLLSSVFLWKEFKWITGEKEKVSIKHILLVSFPMLVSSSLFMVMSWADTIMLGMWRTEEEVGIYNVISRIASILTFLTLSLNATFTPKVAEYYWKKDKQHLISLVSYIARINFFISLFTVAIIAMLSEKILNFFGSEFLENITPLYILLIGQFFNNYFGSVGAILNMTGKEQMFFIIFFISTLLNALLNYSLIPAYGIVGASVATSLSFVFFKFTCAIYIWKIYGFTTFYPVSEFGRR